MLRTYLGTTRGTMSQTLKALENKGYVAGEPSETDKRSLSYALTDRRDPTGPANQRDGSGIGRFA